MGIGADERSSRAVGTRYHQYSLHFGCRLHCGQIERRVVAESLAQPEFF